MIKVTVFIKVMHLLDSRSRQSTVCRPGDIKTGEELVPTRTELIK